MTTINPSMGAAGIGSIDISGMDIETALMMVQSQRVNLLDSQLKDQINEVQKRNDLTAHLNDLQGKLNAMKAKFKSDAKPDDKIADTAENRKLAQDYAETAAALGLPTDPVGANVTRDINGNVTSVTLKGGNDWKPSKSGIESHFAQVKSQLDTASNSQQMDMLRLQSMSNKRNEAFDVMTNFMKKMQDNRSSIIGNMR